MFRLHKEGTTTILIVCILIIIVGALSLYMAQPFRIIIAIGLLIFLFLILYFFRHPDRQIPSSKPLSLYSPCDGKVVVIEEVMESEFLNSKCKQISIFMSPLNVHINWNPMSGLVAYKKHHPGKYLVAWHPKSSTENERTTVVYQSGERQVLVRQIAGAVARRIVNYLEEGQTAEQGDQMGFIKFGSRVDILVPLDTEILVTLEQKVKGNQTLIANLPG